MQWSCDMKWTQGSVLVIDEKIKSHVPNDMSSKFSHALVVSHPCDIANDPRIEPTVEVIFGVLIEVSDGNYEHGKNPRTLHLTLKNNGDNKTIELQACNKIAIHKEVLGKYIPDSSFQLQLSGIKVLQSWLAARYRRHAFPDEFNRRMKSIVDFIVHEGKKHSKAIMGYWVNYEPDQELTREQPYELDIFVVYSMDDMDYESTAKEVTKKIKGKFNGKDFGIILGKCEAYSETEFTYQDMRMNYEYKMDYISLRDEAPDRQAQA